MTRWIKIVFKTFFVLVFVLGYSNCTNKKESNSSSKKTGKIGDEGNVTVTICALRDHSFEVALDLLKNSDFEQRTGICVNAVLLEFDPMVRAHELNFNSKKSSYDLVSIDQPSLGHYVTNGWVKNLNEYINDNTLPSLNLDDVVPVLKTACGEWGNGFYAIPLGSYGALLAYRADILTTAGLNPPKTFEEFKLISKKLTNSPEIYGTALFAHLGEYITADIAPFLWSWGAGLINGCDVDLSNMPKYRAAWSTPEGIAALEFYASLYREKLTHPLTLDFDHERYINAFQSGKVVMGIMPAEGIGKPMEDVEKSKVIGKMAYTTLPGKKLKDGSIASSQPGLGAHSLAISNYSEHPKEAYLVMQFLTGKMIGEEYMKKGGRPFRLSHFSDKAISATPHLKAMRDGMKTGRCRPSIPEYPAVSHIFYTAFHSALKHNAPISDVMKAAAQKANEEVLIPAYQVKNEK